MKLTIARKLILGIIFMVLILVLIVITGIKSINNLSSTANNMETEYIEVSSIQELRISLQEILLSVKNYLNNGNSEEIDTFNHFISKAKKQIVECKQIITNKHSKELLGIFEKDVLTVESLSRKLFKLNHTEDIVAIRIIMDEISSTAYLAVDEIKMISKETKTEMEKYIKVNRETNVRGKRTIIIIGIITAFCLLIGGFFFLRGIIKPLKQLTQIAQQVSSGNLSAKTDIIIHDEIGNVIESFNEMVRILDKTTVSRYYFDNILSRMVDSLIITNADEKIMIVNNSTLNLLGYSDAEIIGQPFGKLLGESVDEKSFNNSEIIDRLARNKQTHNIYNTFYTKDGNKVPVLFSCSLMRNTDGTTNGMLCIAKHTIDSNNGDNTTETYKEKGISSQSIKTVDKIPITNREKEILKLIAEEYSNIEIAEKLFISVRTVETHRKNLMQKLNTKSVIALVKYAALNDII